ncbi:hypothetical protein K435DRAFT_959573 [Dendrothele bispora CBS 962.96]|uniref:PEHE domain-containing protein n=1 Tax=Dendrothele bispora (strain CBS 962.96) TaxID=1314807 RepID=A0A4V4HIP6_DENBC|nr:hypothetical protein K435DRAFT_959573 [Dendrothele bispora CBS 962.96]
MDISSSNPPAQVRQRRVLPSRSRRAGPGAGVGNCDADQMILDTHRRKLEDVPLIPENTRFFLATSASLAPPEASSSRIVINKHSEDRYFDRPEVIKAFRQQTNIETPEFVDINETREVLSRFRARDTDEATMDTSDAAYERRHRKYETMEKRQRLRELEKLKHEQYKLKERIEQLRSMDPSAFLTLPASCFTPIPGHVPVGDDESSANALANNVNGAAAIHEGERRRKEMLEVAQTLENRYRVLLPPERHVKKLANTPTQATGQLPVHSEFDIPISRAPSARPSKKVPVDDGESEVEDDNPERAPPEERLKLKIKMPPKRQSDINKPTRVVVPKKIAHAPSPPPATIEDHPYFPPDIPQSTPIASSDQDNSELVPAPAPMDIIDAHPPSFPDTTVPAIAVLESNTETVDSVHAPNESSSIAIEKNERALARTSESVQPPRKRVKVAPLTSASESPLESASALIPREPSVPPITTLGGESISAPVERRSSKSAQSRAAPKKAPVCQLVVVAKRSVGHVNPRGNIRHNMAFGFKVPPELDMELTYELPLWLLMDDEFQKRAAKHHPNTGVLDPDFHLDPQFIDDVRRASTEPDEDGNVEMKSSKDAILDDELSSLDSDAIKKDESVEIRNADVESEDEVVTSRDER